VATAGAGEAVVTIAGPLLGVRSMAPIHNRMPVILDPADYPRWLDEGAATKDDVQGRPFSPERMRAYVIGPRVGNVKNDDAALIEPLQAA
jgi:putative SOS response-associated peptidase YedK